MKYFLIKYRFESGTREDWHAEIERFISALDADPALSGKISYRCLKSKEGSDCYHLATAADDQAAKTLGERDFFTRYTEKCEAVSGGTVEVVPLELIGETAYRP
jgi:hypothetical protein